ncbi:MAG: ABC transporter ATP-binding protein [Candidatus Tectomicrobia bacterium]|nr:ABC transporter ATP-binding protein [Candidatus Tectomicrobia bacterium]
MLAIEVTQVSKRFALYRRPADRLREAVSFGRRVLHQDLWALRDISFQTAKGTTLGIVGANGAGKSTLLQILAGIMQPTSGRVRREGRIATLFDLGMGFHPEFSGRANVFMNGAILGLSPREIESRYQEIVDFSELGAFMEQPVKIYSTGMFLRLGFSVTTLLDPDILMIDEVISVGDQHFQKKCVDKILSFKARGKTILFCSHNTWQLKQICDQVAWIDAGRLRGFGAADAVVDAYVDYQRSLDVKETGEAALVANQAPARPHHHPALRDIRISKGGGSPTQAAQEVAYGDSFQVEVAFEVFDAAYAPVLAVVIVRNDGSLVYGVSTEIDGYPPLAEVGVQQKSLAFPRLEILSGEYALTIFLLDNTGVHVYDMAEKVCPFVVRHATKEVGVCRLEHVWKL